MKLSLFVIAVLVPAAAGAERLEDALAAPHVSELTAARARNRIAWVMSVRGVRNIFVADGPDYKPRQLTRATEDDGVQLATLRFFPDGNTLVYARGNETDAEGAVVNPRSAVAGGTQEIVAVDVDSGKEEKLAANICGRYELCGGIYLAPRGKRVAIAGAKALFLAEVGSGKAAEAVKGLRGRPRDARFSPDGTTLAVSVERTGGSEIALVRAGDATVNYVAPSLYASDFPRWSADGKLLAFVRSAPQPPTAPLIPEWTTTWSIWVWDGREAREVWRSGTRSDDSLPELTLDKTFGFAGDRILFASEADGWNHVYAVAPGKPAQLLTRGAADVDDVTVAADGKSILYTTNLDDADRRHVWVAALDGGTPRRVTRGDGVEWAPAMTGDAQFCLGATATASGAVLRIDGRTRPVVAATPAGSVVPTAVTFKSPDGVLVRGQLFTPRAPNGAAVVFIHGGPIRQMLLGYHPMGYYHLTYALNQHLAARGFTVLSVNYRGGTMYGRAFREPERFGWRGSSELADVVAAGRYLRGLPGIRRVGTWGGSYGGLLTALALARSSDLFAAGVDISGVHDWAALVERATSAPDREAAAKMARESSPVSSVTTWRSPVLIITGDDDDNVPVMQSVDLFHRLRAARVPMEQLVLPDQPHFMPLWRTWVTVYAATTDFVERTLVKGETIGVPH